MNELKAALEELHQETQRLVNAALDDTGNPEERAARARELDGKLRALWPRVEAVGQEREQLELIWQAAERDLIFLLFEAGTGQEADEEALSAGDVTARAMAINSKAFELAKAVIKGQVEPEVYRERVRELDRQIQDLVGQPGQGSPEVQRALSEADLDLTFAYEGGKGAMSLRVHQYLEQSAQS